MGWSVIKYPSKSIIPVYRLCNEPENFIFTHCRQGCYNKCCALRVKPFCLAKIHFLVWPLGQKEVLGVFDKKSRTQLHTEKRGASNEIQTIGMDVDGTLLNNNREITEKKRAIHQVIDRGVIFTISSGRPVQEAMTRAIGVDIPVITYNGAMVITGSARKSYTMYFTGRRCCLIEKLDGSEYNIWQSGTIVVC